MSDLGESLKLATAAIRLASGLSIRDLGVVYRTRSGTIEALREVALDVRPGEFVSLLGPSGCGKSTILKIVAGLISPSSGVVRLGGRDVQGPSQQIGVAFQKPTTNHGKVIPKSTSITTSTASRPSTSSARTIIASMPAIVTRTSVAKNSLWRVIV